MESFHVALKSKVFERGQSDWVSMAELFDIAKDLGSSRPRESAIEFVAKESETGAIVAGRYSSTYSFVRWPQVGNRLRDRLTKELDNSPPDDPLAAESEIMIETQD